MLSIRKQLDLVKNRLGQEGSSRRESSERFISRFEDFYGDAEIMRAYAEDHLKDLREDVRKLAVLYGEEPDIQSHELLKKFFEFARDFTSTLK